MILVCCVLCVGALGGGFAVADTTYPVAAEKVAQEMVQGRTLEPFLAWAQNAREVEYLNALHPELKLWISAKPFDELLEGVLDLLLAAQADPCVVCQVYEQTHTPTGDSLVQVMRDGNACESCDLKEAKLE